MKTILEYQKEYWFNNSMITEAFKSKILQEISNQLNDRIKKQKEEAENDKEHYHTCCSRLVIQIASAERLIVYVHTGCQC